MDYKKLLDYNQHMRHRYFDTFCKLPWEEFVKDRGASFGSIRNIFLHCIDVLDNLLNRHILGVTEWKNLNFDEYNSFDEIRYKLERVESDANNNFSQISAKDLSKILERKFSDGTVIQTTVEDTLIHLFQEETHHRGEFIALLWQMNIEPPHLGWFRYVNM